MNHTPARFRVHIEPGGHDIEVAAGDNVLAAALAAGIALPHSCRAGRCASCKARIVSGQVGYPQGRLPPGIVASETARGEVLLCQAQPQTDLHIDTRGAAPLGHESHGVIVGRMEPLALGGMHASLRILGPAMPGLRPGQFVEVETATGERERVPVVAATGSTVDIEVHELAPAQIIRLRGPFDTPR
jgi:CDP-4-dehydro-6-deoxyglucose reductase, E3